MYDLERYLDVRSAGGATVGPDGSVSFLLDATGVSQVWTLSEPGAWPEQRTFYEEPVSFASYSPTRSELVFGMDRGGDERTQLYRLDPEGRITDLTATPDAKHRWGGWSRDGERFAFTSNRRDEAVFDVYVQARDATGDEADLVLEADGWLSVAGWSPDDERLALVEAHSNFEQDVSVLSLDDGSVTDLTAGGEPARFRSLQWAPDGEGLYCVTDRAPESDDTAAGEALEDDGTGERRDTLSLAHLDLEGRLRTVADGGAWNVDDVSVDVDTGRFAFSRNVEGDTELTVGEFTGPTTYDTLPEPALPGGIAGGVAWGPEAEQFAVSVTGRTVNTNVFLVETETGAAKRWTHASTAGIPDSTFVEPEVIRFESFDEREIPALFSLPAGVRQSNTSAGAGDGERSEDADLPVIVDVHGGPESQRRPSFSGLTQYFLSRGYAVFEPNVRGSTGYGREYTQLDDVENRLDSVADLAAGAEWLSDRPAVDPDRIAVMGGSYGGFMVLAAMTNYPDLWAAGVDVVGIANFVTFLENTGAWRRELREAEYGSLADDREFLESISPIHDVDQITAPLFVLHGENDPRVPVGEAEQIVAAVRERDVPVETLVFEDEGHGISKLTNRIEAYTRVVEFLNDHV